jgi:predicted cobalt transporter CbtA
LWHGVKRLNHRGGTVECLPLHDAITALKAALVEDALQRFTDVNQEIEAALAEPVQAPQCNPHPKAPHSFMRNASHNEDRYVCECEGWEPYEAGYQAGMEAALRAQS